MSMNSIACAVQQTSTTCCTFLKRMLLIMYLSLGTFLVSKGQSAGANLDQGSNDAYTTPMSPMAWVNGNLNPNQAHYIERHSVPYRLVMSNMPINQVVTVTLGFDLVNSGRYALDF